jgi:FAD synthase
MKITLENFGGFRGLHSLEMKSKTLKNGEGKTSTVNAYVFALTGKTLNGFEPVNIYADEQVYYVVLEGFLGLPDIRRVVNKTGGTTLYVGGDVVTQTLFEQYLKGEGYDLDFIVACANANVLTSNDLTAETLRKILTASNVLDGEEYTQLKKELTELRKKRKLAEQYALNNVIVPEPKCEQLNVSERTFLGNYQRQKKIVIDGVQSCCPTCKRAYEKSTIAELSKAYEAAEKHVAEFNDEYERILRKSDDFALEEQNINEAKRIVESATRARKDVINLDLQIADVQKTLQELDAKNVQSNLPSGVTVVTEVTQKNGVVKPTCTIEYNGIPLRNINHAKRIEIQVAILDAARQSKNNTLVPIIIDNAEAVTHEFSQYKNVILFKAG